MPIRKDFILRWIEYFGAVLAKLLRGEPGTSLLVAKLELEDAIRQLLGPLEQLADHLSAEQLGGLLDDPYRMYGYARLLAFQSALARLEGNPAGATRLAQRGLVIARMAAERIVPPPTEWREWIEAGEADLNADAVPADPEST